MLATRRTGLNICSIEKQSSINLSIVPERASLEPKTYHLDLLPEADKETGSDETDERSDRVQERELDRRSDEEQDGSDERDDEAGQGACARAMRDWGLASLS